MISIIIPHRGRDEVLKWHLNQLKFQSYQNFEVIVVGDYRDDENDDNVRALVEGFGYRYLRNPYVGPGPARNAGAEIADGNVVLITGSDCIPHHDLVAFHAWAHMYGADIAQGYTPFHKDVISPFYEFLDESGLQANWANLKDKNGWMREISPLFCLTTNYSIKRQLLLNEPFSQELDQAAWDDIELGYRLSKYGTAIRTMFLPEAVNYHYHKYDIDSFLDRCRMEGYNRVKLALIHPEMGWGLMNPYEMRAVKRLSPESIRAWVHELDGVDLSTENKQTKKLKEIKYDRYGEACRIFSYMGVMDRLNDEHPAMQAIMNIHMPVQMIQILTGVRALRQGHLSYACHTAEWYATERDDDWSAHAYAGEIHLACGNGLQALMAFQRSVEINPGEKWPRERLDQLGKLVEVRPEGILQ